MSIASVGIGYSAHQWSQPCNCIGPQPGERLCPCMLRSEAARRAAMREEILAEMLQRFGKPRIRVKAGSRPL